MNIFSNSYYLQQYNLVFVKESMVVTTCWINYALVYPTYPTSLRFDDQVTKSLVPVLLLTITWEKLLILKLNYQCWKYGSMLYYVYMYIYIYKRYIYIIHIYLYIYIYSNIQCTIYYLHFRKKGKCSDNS